MHGRILFFALWLCSILLSGSVQAGQDSDRAPTQWFALLIGNERYQGKGAQLPTLEFTDNDMLRWARLLSPTVPGERVQLFLQPDIEVAAELQTLGLSYAAPTLHNVQGAFDALSAQLAKSRRLHRDTRLNVLVAVSAHGDKGGIHLEDERLLSRELRSKLASLDADQVLVIADVCFSAESLGLPHLPPAQVGDASATKVLSEHFKQWREASKKVPDAVQESLKDLRLVGAVTSVSPTQELAGIHSGLLTHMVTSALAGPGDLDKDGHIQYDELQAYLEHYQKDTLLLPDFRVHPPKMSERIVPTLWDLRQTGTSGIQFLAQNEEPGTLCYFIQDEVGLAVAEMCKEASEATPMLLRPGRYQVRELRQAIRNMGKVYKIDVHDTLTVLTGMESAQQWHDPTFPLKGSSAEDRQVPISRLDAAALVTQPQPETLQLSVEASEYLRLTPYRRSIGWRSAPDRMQLRMRLATAQPFYSLSPYGEHTFTLPFATSSPGHVASLTQETSAISIGGVLDSRILPLQRRQLFWGLSAVGSLSPGNAVLDCDGQWVYAASYRVRIGLEHDQRRLALQAGGLSATSSCAQGSSTLQTQTTALQTGLEWSQTHYLSPWLRVELGMAPIVTFELQQHGAVVFAVPYVGAELFLGIRL